MSNLRIGPYTLIRRLAIGGMGEVFLAKREDQTITEEVALKRLLPHFVSERHFVDRFVDEARLMTALRHPNILPVFELRHDTWGLYMAMEYLTGHDVRSINRHLRERNEHWSPRLAVWLTREVCAGLSYAHQKTDESGEELYLIHRDISPSNILLGGAGEVKLTDFGVARAHGNIHQSISGALQGKLAYMSPEQASGDTLSQGSDLFSLGVTLWEMLVGIRPRGDGSDAEILRLAQSQEPLHIEEMWADANAHPHLCSIINRSLHPDPQRRFPSATDLSKALGEWLLKHSAHSAESPFTLDELDVQLKAEFIKWHSKLSSEISYSTVSLDEAIELQLLGNQAPLTPLSKTSETLSINPQESPVRLISKVDLPGAGPPVSLIGPSLSTEADEKIDESLSGVLVTAEQGHFNDMLNDLIGEASFQELPQKESPQPFLDDLSGEEPSSALPKFRDQAHQIRIAKISILLIFSLSAFALIWSLFGVEMYGKQSFDIALTLVQDEENKTELSSLHNQPDWIPYVTIDGEPWDPLFLYQTSAPLEVCIQVKEWQRSCKWLTIKQLPTRTLTSSSVPQLFATFTLLSQDINHQEGTNLLSTSRAAPQLKASPKPKPKTSPKPKPKASPKPKPKPKTPSKPKTLSKLHQKSTARLSIKGSSSDLEFTRSLQIKCTPMVDGSIKLEQQRPAESLFVVKTERELRCELSAKGYAKQVIRISPSRQANVNITLSPRGRISIRVHPPAAQLYLNGQLISNPSHKLGVTGSKHILRASYQSGKTLVRKTWSLTLEPGERLKRFYDLTQGPRD